MKVQGGTCELSSLGVPNGAAVLNLVLRQYPVPVNNTVVTNVNQRLPGSIGTVPGRRW